MRRERVFRDGSNLLEIYSSEDIVNQIHFPKETVLTPTDELAEVLSPVTLRSLGI